MTARNTHKKKFVHAIEIRNETEFTDLFETHKNYIYEHVSYFVNTFPFDIDLLVIFRVLDESKSNFVNAETENGGMTITDNRYTVILNIDSLKRIQYDNGLDIALSLEHELWHTYDIYNTMHNKYYEINPLLNKIDNIDDFVINKGAGFWTEFYAYYMTFKYYKQYHRYPTFLQLVKAYEKLQEQFRELKAFPDYKTQIAKEELESFIERIGEFSYALAKHVAGEVKGKPYEYDYCEKTRNTESFISVGKMKYGIAKRIQPLFVNTYGKGMARKLYELGDYIIRHIYGKFDIWPVKHYKYIRFAFYM